jgi:hypothetical protein
MSSIGAPGKGSTLSHSGNASAASGSGSKGATAVVAPTVVSLESVNAKVKKLWIIYANPRVPALDRRVYTDLFIQFGQALCRHIEDSQPLPTPLFDGFKNNLIQLVWNRPELTKIAEVGLRIVNSLMAVSKKLPTDSLTRKPALNTHLLEMVMNLFIVKETLLLMYRDFCLRTEVSHSEAERAKLCPARPHPLTGQGRFDTTAVLMERAEVSVEALVIFCKYVSLKSVSVGDCVEEIYRLEPLTRPMIEELNGFSTHAHQHVREVAAMLLLFDKVNKTVGAYSEFLEEYESFSARTNAVIKLPLIEHLQPFIPELIKARNGLVEIKIRTQQKDPSLTPELEDNITLARNYEAYMSAATERHFAYQMFYTVLSNQQGTSGVSEKEFRQRYLSNHALSFCHRGSELPTPEEFAALAYGGEAVSSAIKTAAPAPTATAAASADHKSSKDDKVPEDGKTKDAQKAKPPAKEDIPTPYKQAVKPEKEKPQKKDPFAYLAKEGATAAAVAPQSDEPPKTSKFGSAGAPAVVVATGVATQTALEAVFTGRSVDLKAIQYAPRVDAAIKATTDWQHGFTTALDKFLGTPSYSMQTTWKNPTTGQNDTLHCFVVEAENAQGQKTRHVATYAVDSRNVCYHRCLQHKSHKNLVDQIMRDQIRDKLDYPSLKESAMAASGKLKMVTGKIDDSEMRLDQAFGIVSVKDKRHKMIFRVIPKPIKYQG